MPVGKICKFTIVDKLENDKKIYPYISTHDILKIDFNPWFAGIMKSLLHIMKWEMFLLFSNAVSV